MAYSKKARVEDKLIKTIARDGYLAYTLPDWTREKLDYIDKYLGIVTKALRDQKELVYADLLAGPGVCVDMVTGEEQAGSALLAVRRPESPRLYINDASSHVTLRFARGLPPNHRDEFISPQRTAISRSRKPVISYSPSGNDRNVLGIAVIDPQAYQMRFDAIQRLTADVRMDLVIVFMTSFARRFLGQPSFAAPLGSMIGEAALEQLIWRKRRGEQPGFADLLDGFEAQLNSIGYDHVFTPTRTENSRRSTMYRIVFAREPS